MRINDKKGTLKQVVLEPGEHYITDKPIMISTLLGSCVAACLYDQVNRVIGMNHFLLSNKRYRREGPLIPTEAGRYGIHAMELVINGMLKLGAKRKYLKAKAFGGGNIFSLGDKLNKYFYVGEINTRFIREFLDNEKIPLITSDLGGETGRVIRFYGSDYAVYVRKIKNTQSQNFVERDRKHWEKRIKEREVKNTEIELWQ